MTRSSPYSRRHSLQPSLWWKSAAVLAISLAPLTTPAVAQDCAEECTKELRIAESFAQPDSLVSIPIILDSDEDLVGVSVSIVTDDPVVQFRELDLTNATLRDSTNAAVPAMPDFAKGRVSVDGRHLNWGIATDLDAPFEKVIPAGPKTVVGELVLTVSPTATPGTTLEIRFEDIPADLLATPPDPGAKTKLVRAGGESMEFAASAGTLTIVPSEVGPFLRGDCNQDGSNTGDTADAIFRLDHAFNNGEPPTCRAACDFNGDGDFEVAITDAVYLLQFNFFGTEAPPPPLRACAMSPALSDAILGCELPNGCAE